MIQFSVWLDFISGLQWCVWTRSETEPEERTGRRNSACADSLLHPGTKVQPVLRIRFGKVRCLPSPISGTDELTKNPLFALNLGQIKNERRFQRVVASHPLPLIRLSLLMCLLLFISQKSILIQRQKKQFLCFYDHWFYKVVGEPDCFGILSIYFSALLFCFLSILEPVVLFMQLHYSWYRFWILSYLFVLRFLWPFGDIGFVSASAIVFAVG